MYKQFWYVKSGPHKGKQGECVSDVNQNGEVQFATLLCCGELIDVAPEEVIPLPITQGYAIMSDRLEGFI